MVQPETTIEDIQVVPQARRNFCQGIGVCNWWQRQKVRTLITFIPTQNLIIQHSLQMILFDAQNWQVTSLNVFCLLYTSLPMLQPLSFSIIPSSLNLAVHIFAALDVWHALWKLSLSPGEALMSHAEIKIRSVAWYWSCACTLWGSVYALRHVESSTKLVSWQDVRFHFFLYVLYRLLRFRICPTLCLPADQIRLDALHHWLSTMKTGKFLIHTCAWAGFSACFLS